MRKQKGKKGGVGDWEWVGSEVKKAEDITDAHRRRAAGLDSTSGHLSDGSIVCTEDKAGCKEAKCKRNLRCYNHLGAEELVKDDAEERFIKDKLGELPSKREGKAGLRNLGATCYANAFLQLWFHNIPFRNGVYQCLASEASAMSNLATVFASLQYSDRGYVDTSGLVKALSLDTGNQQDAAEFSKLFMDLIANEFRRQSDPKVQHLVDDLFQGDIEYLTICETCQYRSTSRSPFLELELSLQDGQSLHERLKVFMSPELLEGDNMYRCPRCNQLRRATRQVKPMNVPPFLHFSLNRFVYDAKLGDRKKVKATIEYPKSLTLAGKAYELCGVITHQGTTAHSGHFICDVLEENDGEWYNCNDEVVTKKSDPPRKKPKLTLNGDGKIDGESGSSNGNQKSKDAYMLVYKQKQKQGEGHPTLQPRPEIMERVKADNDGLKIQFEELDTKKLEARKLFGELKDIKMEVMKRLPGTNRIIPRESLASWIGADSLEDLKRPFDMDEITCEHGSVDPEKTGNARLISQAAFDRLSDYVKLLPLEVCRTCVEDRFNQLMNQTDRIEQIENFEALNENRELEWLVSTAWLKAWRKSKLPPDCTPTDDKYSILCAHGIPQRAASTLVSEEALLVLRSAVGEFESWKLPIKTCQECESDLEQKDLLEAEWKSLLQTVKPIKRDLNSSDCVFDIDYYALPISANEKLLHWFTHPGPLPDIKIGLCEHQGIDFDPMMEYPKYLSATGWEAFVERFGEQTPIVIRFGANPLPDKRTPVSFVSQRVCDDCRSKRLQDWVQTNVYVTMIEEMNSESSTPISDFTILPGPSSKTTNGDRKAALSQLADRRRSARVSVSNIITIAVDKSSTVKDLKLAIMNKRKISPIAQQIYYNDRLLDSGDTMEGIGLLQDASLKCVVLEEKEEKGTGLEGFGGTALVGGIPCPACTFVNPGGSEKCAVCETAFGLGEAFA